MDLLNYKAKKTFDQKHLLTLQDWSKDEILQCLSLAIDIKAKHKKYITNKILEGMGLVMIFAKSSTRTRVSFEMGIQQLGGYSVVLTPSDSHLGRGETVADTAKVLSRYADGIMIRTFKHSDVVDMANNSTIPIINGLTDDYHPCQVLADLLTIYEHKKKISGLKMAFLGDGNNMANSLLLGCSKVGMDIAVSSPEGYLPNPQIVKIATENARKNGSQVLITTDPELAVRNADVIYTDVWASMGQEDETEDRIIHFAPYQVNEHIFSKSADNAIFLHCLPAHRGEEVTGKVIDGPNSVVFDEAENRLHAQKAIMALLMTNHE